MRSRSSMSERCLTVMVPVIAIVCILQSSVALKPFQQQRNSTKIVCYFDFPHDYRNSTMPPALSATLCTHVIFIGLPIVDCQMALVSPNDTIFFQNMIPLLKKQNPAIKVSESIQFIDSAVILLRKNGFDGLDVDWEFPGWNPKPIGQRKNFTLLVQGMRAAFEKEAVQTKRERLALSAAVSGVEELMVIYQIKELGEALDLVNLMGYDYHSPNPEGHSRTGYNSPVYAVNDEKAYFTRNLNWSSHAWVSGGLPKEKLVVGVPTYCKAYKLELPFIWHGHDAPADGQGDCESADYVCAFESSADEIAKEMTRGFPGSLKDQEPCTAIKQYDAKRVFDEKAQVPYIYYKNQWVSYEDEESMTMKAKFVIQNGYGGIMIFRFAKDDYLGVCNGTKFPLISAVHRTIFGH